MTIYVRILLLLVALLVACPAFGQGLSIDITSPGQTQANIVLPRPLAAPGTLMSGMAPELEAAIHENLGFMPFLRQMNAGAILGGDTLAGPTRNDIDFKRFSLSEVDLVVSQYWNGNTVELRTYEVFGGRLLFGLEFPGLKPSLIPRVADRFCARLMETLTGVTGFFESKLAFVRKQGTRKEIWVAGPTGRDARQVTRAGGVNLSPAWSPDGQTIAFTHVGNKGHLLGLGDPNGSEAKLLDLAGSSVISPAYAPNGLLAVTMDLAGEPNIYLLDDSFRKTTTLTGSWSIDVSPSFDDSGRQMVFASGRMGNPHIFLLDVPTGQVRRITYEGKYNTNPSMSPDGRTIVFSRDTPDGHRLFLHDLITGLEKQLTFGPGSDEEPTFGPDGYYIAFCSNRTGAYKVYLTTRHGDEPVLLPTGDGEAKSPAWTRKASTP